MLYSVTYEEQKIRSHNSWVLISFGSGGLRWVQYSHSFDRDTCATVGQYYRKFFRSHSPTRPCWSQQIHLIGRLEHSGIWLRYALHGGVGRSRKCSTDSKLSVWLAGVLGWAAARRRVLLRAERAHNRSCGGEREELHRRVAFCCRVRRFGNRHSHRDQSIRSDDE